MSFASQDECAFRFDPCIDLAVVRKPRGVPGIAALPAANSADILAQRMGGAGAGVALLISVIILLGILRLPALAGNAPSYLGLPVGLGDG